MKLLKSIWQWIKNVVVLFWNWFKELFTDLLKNNNWGWANLAIFTVLTSLYFRLYNGPITMDILRNGAGLVLFFAIFAEMLKFLVFFGLRGEKVELKYGTLKKYWRQLIGNIILAQFGFWIGLI